MAEPKLFDKVCELLDAATDLDKLESRGTIRLALKSAGLDARSLDKGQMDVLLERVLPGELNLRGVADAHEACEQIAAGIRDLDGVGPDRSSPEEIFRDWAEADAARATGFLRRPVSHSWRARHDSNVRPLAPQASALSN